MATQANPYITPEEYLEIERKAPFRSEYCNGQMFAMAGATLQHNKILGNLTEALRPRCRAEGCNTYTSELRLHIPASGFYTYPDLMVICGEEQLLDGQFDAVTNPVLVVEVLSPSTEDYDRGGKFLHYRSIPSLREYITVAQDRFLIEQHVLDNEKRAWVLTDHSNTQSSITLASVQSITLSIAAIYQGVLTFPEAN